MSKLVIGITGKSGSGKSTVAEEIGKAIPNSVVVEVDSIGHDALCRPTILENLIQIFGNEILDDKGNVDRKKLGNIVFAERKKMQKLGKITGAYISEKIKKIIDENQGVVILDWILLPLDSAWQRCDIKILIQTDFQKRKENVLLRDSIPAEYFDARETTSIEYNHDEFDYIFDNDYSWSTIEAIVKTISFKI